MKDAILIISPEPWEGHAVSKHHYAREMVARGHDVLFLDPPTGRMGSIALRTVALPNLEGRLRVVQGGPVMRGLGRLPQGLRCWLEARWLARLERKARTRVAVVWLFENSRFYDMGFAGTRLKIYHQVDLNQDLHAARAAASADAVLCTTRAIADQLRPHHPAVLKLHHGVQVAPPQATGQAPTQLPTQLPTPGPLLLEGQGPHAMYVGNLDIAYLDVPLMVQVIGAHPDVTFHLVGGYHEAGALFQALGKASNLRWWGRRPAAEIPNLLAQADILMLTYLAQQFRDQLASPHKVMEYLAAGPVCVATWTDEYANRRDLLEMVETASEYSARFAAVLADLPKYNSAAARAHRMAFAQDHTYRAQVDRIRAHLTARGLDHDL